MAIAPYSWVVATECSDQSLLLNGCWLQVNGLTTFQLPNVVPDEIAFGIIGVHKYFLKVSFDAADASTTSACRSTFDAKCCGH